MEEQTYCIGLGQSFDTQRRKKEFVNVYFVSKDKSYSYAHKVLLCHLLPFWRDLLYSEESNSDDTFVILPDYSKEDIETWLDKVYNIESVVNRTALSKKTGLSDPQAAHPSIALTLDCVKFEKKCDTCSKNFVNKKTYHAHMMTHRPEKWKFKCDMSECNQFFRTTRHLRLHKFKEHQKGLQCHICQKSYSSDANLKDHIKNVHQNEQYPCENCGKIFKSKTYLKSHLKLAHLDTTQHFRSCPICQKSCKGRYYYQHIKSHDSSSYSHICKDCGDMFLTKYKLIEHQSLVHTGEAHFPCPICGETFLTTARRALHKKTHNQSTIDFSII